MLLIDNFGGIAPFQGCQPLRFQRPLGIGPILNLQRIGKKCCFFIHSYGNYLCFSFTGSKSMNHDRKRLRCIQNNNPLFFYFYLSISIKFPQFYYFPKVFGYKNHFYVDIWLLITHSVKAQRKIEAAFMKRVIYYRYDSLLVHAIV